MSSHREAPEVSKDPVADNTDTYAFVSPDNPGTVTIITNYIPLENPAGGPNFFEFGDDVLYSIYIDNDGDARPNITYQAVPESHCQRPGLAAVQHRPARDAERAHDRDAGPDQEPDERRDGSDGCDELEVGARIWGAASRQSVQIIDGFDDSRRGIGPWAQVSRLGNPLFNEVIVPLGKKDQWNAAPPSADAAFAQYVKQPELAKLLPVLYPGVFPNLAKLTADRADLVAILLTGIPPESFQGSRTSPATHRPTCSG